MLQHVRSALIEKLEKQREHEPYCKVQWLDTRKIEVIPQRYIQLLPSGIVHINVTYTILIDGSRRYGTVLVTGTKEHCESTHHKDPHRGYKIHATHSPVRKDANQRVDDMMLMKIVGKLMHSTSSNGSHKDDDVHDAKCASCRMKPIRHVDLYHCLECPSSSNYDLCGRCFEKRRETEHHSSGHAMVQFKLPNEFLGIPVHNVNNEVTLKKLRQLNTLQNEHHKGIKCDGTCQQKHFYGLRFKCDACPNYNLCEKCAIEKHICTKSHERNHPMILTSNSFIPKIDPSDIEFKEVLGRGGYGYVCKAIWRSRNREVACKVIEVSSTSAISHTLERSFHLELAAYRELSGLYILRTFGYATRELPANHIRGTTTQFMILMELMGRGSLQDLLENEPHKVSLRHKVTMARQIASGMKRIHQHGMVHRDIRPDNILVNDDYVAKIGDMGLARVIDPNGQQTQLGCLPFMPPEFFHEQSEGHIKFDEKLDIYTYGLTLNQLFTETMHDFHLNRSTSRIVITKPSPVFYDEIIVKCLETDSKQRPTAIEIEKTLELYEEAFSETRFSDSYTRLTFFEQQREHELYCKVQWSDTKQTEVIPQRYIQVSPPGIVHTNVTYTIFINGVGRNGTVLVTGTKEHCESSHRTHVHYGSKTHATHSPVEKGSDQRVDDMMLMKIVGKLMHPTSSNGSQKDEDVHDAECASCKMKPIRHVDRYHCLECPSSSNYDLCGRCFEKRRETEHHSSGHAMVQFKLPNEFLGIPVHNVNNEVTLHKLKHLSTLQNEHHKGIKCDGTCQQKHFYGLRFKCDACPNYNLCETCAIEKHICTKSHERNHPMILTSNSFIPKIDPTDIEFREILGRGAFGYVCKAIWRSRNREVACKVIEVSGASAISHTLERSFHLELAAYRELSGLYILRTFGYATRELPANHIRGITTQFMILMELMGRGSLQNVLEKEPHNISLRRRLTMARQIASGMKRIHQHGMVHRDIRPDNILVNDDYVAKIGDMGIARVIDPNGQQTQLGCLQFMPPEFFHEQSEGHIKCDEKLDIYTYGLTLNQLFTETMHDFHFDHSTSRIIITKPSPVFYDEIIVKCLETDSKQRPIAVEIEKTLELYEEAFNETRISDGYTRMNTQEKDKVFLEF
ncbi:unnamed protein product [Adineta steineri]|uniref:Uncharacterized protein n=1 Tax=Adineta steineri TaxID=433720 RepID=A0A813VWC1_9BILA|nr:unnamed protein product [Adineta steineri]